MIQGNGVNWTIIIWLCLKVFSRTTLVRSLVVLNRFYPRWSCWFVEFRPSCFSQPGNSHGPDVQYPLVVRNQHTSPRFGNLWCSAGIWLAVVLHAILSQASRWNRHVFLNCLAWRHAQHGRPLKIFRGIKAACRGVHLLLQKLSLPSKPTSALNKMKLWGKQTARNLWKVSFPTNFRCAAGWHIKPTETCQWIKGVPNLE